LEDHALRRKFEDKKTQLPWYWRFDECIEADSICAVTSKAEILSSARNDDKSLEVKRRRGEHELFCTIRSVIRCFAVDENDNVYIVVEIPSCNENVPSRYKLLILDSDVNVTEDRFLDVIDAMLFFPQMSVTKDGMIVIYGRISRTMYICDSTNTRQDYKFPFPFKDTYPRGLSDCSFTVSNKNEIIFTFGNYGENKFFLYIITIAGKLKRKVQVPLERMWGIILGSLSLSVVFNHVNETILVSLYDGNNDNPTTTIFCFSDTGEFLHQFDILGEYHQLLSHRANGHILLVNQEEAITLQM
jgi:hypothetical protein